MTAEAEGRRPPKLASRVIRWAAGAEEADEVAGALAEAFRARVTAEGRRRARRWYRLQALGWLVRAPALWTVRREEGSMGWFGDVGGDLRWALRGLRRRPTFAAVAVATLALGIGSNSAIFTLVSAHFLTPLPYQRPARLALIWEADRATGDVMTVSPGNYFAWKEEARSLGGVAAFNVDAATLSGDGAAEQVTASLVTPDFFDVLGVRPELGAGFTAAAAREASGDLVILSHALWLRRFGSDPGVVGRSVRVDGRPHMVVGVMSAGFRQPERSLAWQGAQLWRPLLLQDQHDDFSSHYLRTVARLAPGATLQSAQTELAGLADRLTLAHPEEGAAWTVSVRTLDDYLLGDARPILALLLVAGVAVLLLVCANVANLTLARGQERRREFALRAALGSGGGRLLRQVLVEALLLSCLGAAVGILGVVLAGGALQGLQERYLSSLTAVHVDGAVVAATALIAAGAGLLTSLPLARAASRAALRESLGEGGTRGGSGRGATRTRNGLIVGQVALAAALLVVSALLVRSFDALVSVPPGFDPLGRVTFDVSAPRTTYPDAAALERYLREVRRTVAAVPGVDAVSMTSDLPFTSENRWTRFGLEGRPWDEASAPRADYHVVLPDYFATMGIPLVAGRVFEEVWAPVPMDGCPVVVNERMAAMLAPEGTALGRGVVLVRDGTPLTLRVVGVVHDVLDDGYAGQPEPIFYLPWGVSPQRSMAVVVRAHGDAAGIMDGVRRAVATVDPDVPAAGLRTMDALLAATVARPRAASRIGTTLALLALLVAAAGIYGVLSVTVQGRTREIGIRAALGADTRRILAMVLGDAARLIAVGLGLGLLGALVAGTVLSGMLFGVRPWDPVSLTLTVAVLGGVGLLAAWLPARRAVRVDPKEALSAE